MIQSVGCYECTTILDLGTGGGLPGIPLAILRPDMQFTLVDSIQKKIKAVEDIVSILPLPKSRLKRLSVRANLGLENFPRFNIAVVLALFWKYSLSDCSALKRQNSSKE